MSGTSSTYTQYRVVELCKTRPGPPEGYQACVYVDCRRSGGSQRGQLILGGIHWESDNLEKIAFTFNEISKTLSQNPLMVNLFR